jgi:geranylgeranyl pyrophosphate synthase
MTGKNADAEIKKIPCSTELREEIRRAAGEFAIATRTGVMPDWEELRRAARELLTASGLEDAYAGFAMIALENAFWRDAFAATPFSRRILLLPHCLRNAAACRGRYEATEMICAGCGGCRLAEFKAKAEALGYRVIIAEGTPGVLRLIMRKEYDAVLGVACLDSLEKSFHRIFSLGLPHQAAPLLRDGCENTEAEFDHLAELLSLQSESAASFPSYVPLLRFAADLFEEGELARLLDGYVSLASPERICREPLEKTACVAGDWLRTGGKRLRPFVTLAAYAVGKYGSEALRRGFDLDGLLPDGARRVALAIEATHKASLVHDDIEDGDDLRYGAATVHAKHGVPFAINVGDYLVGLGYSLIAEEASSLGGRCAADILAEISRANVELARGQGAELAWWKNPPARRMKPVDALAIYAHKTAPAFFAAIYAGLRMAGKELDVKLLSAYARALGVGFQILDDLAEWQPAPDGVLPEARDFASGRPTLLRVFAEEEAAQRNLSLSAANEYEAREMYRQLGVFAKAGELADRYRSRAAMLAREAGDADVGGLLLFLTEIILGTG